MTNLKYLISWREIDSLNKSTELCVSGGLFYTLLLAAAKDFRAAAATGQL